MANDATTSSTAAARTCWQAHSASNETPDRATSTVDIARKLKVCWSSTSPAEEGFYCARTSDGDIYLEDVWLDGAGALRIGCENGQLKQMTIGDYKFWAGPIVFVDANS